MQMQSSGVLLESDQSLIIRVEVGPGAFLLLDKDKECFISIRDIPEFR